MKEQLSLKTTYKINISAKLLRKIKENIQAYVLMSPALFFFIAFSIYPIFWAIQYCMYDYTGSSLPLFIGLNNFKEIFNFKHFYGNMNDTNWVFWTSWGRTGIYVALKLCLEIPFALFCSVMIYKNIRGSNFFKVLFYMPQILPGMVLYMVFEFMLNPYNGALNQILSTLGIIPHAYSIFAHSTSAFATGVLIDVWHSFGINMLFFLAGLANIPGDVYESAAVDGATEIKTFIFITLPMMARMTQIIVMLAIIGSFKAMGSFFILTQGGADHSTELTFYYIYKLYFNPGGGVPRYGYGAAVGVVSAVIIGLIAMTYKKITNKMQYD